MFVLTDETLHTSHLSKVSTSNWIQSRDVLWRIFTILYTSATSSTVKARARIHGRIRTHARTHVRICFLLPSYFLSLFKLSSIGEQFTTCVFIIFFKIVVVVITVGAVTDDNIAAGVVIDVVIIS